MILLDTNAVVWASVQPALLSRAASLAITEADTILVSAASAWEIATKVRLGKLPGAEHLERDYLGFMQKAGYTLIPVDTQIALRAARLTGEHRDPFDRLIAAHALAQDMPVVSADPKLDLFGVRRIW